MLPKVVEQAWYIGKKKLWLTTEVLQQRQAEDATLANSLVIVKLDLELIATERPFAPNNYLSDPNQHNKNSEKSIQEKSSHSLRTIMNNLKMAACLLFETIYWEFVVNLK